MPQLKVRDVAEKVETLTGVVSKNNEDLTESVSRNKFLIYMLASIQLAHIVISATL